MARYAKITDGIVTGINVTPATPAPEWTPAPPDVQIGWLYDGEAFSPPAPSPQPLPLSRLQFEGLVQHAAQLTDAQFLAALDDAALRLMWHRLNIASQVERDHELTQAGMAALVATGHLTEAHVQAIVDAWPDA